jgi:3-hydroxybenzoate 4-monooxygenase
VTFWKPDEKAAGKIVRHGRVQDTEDGLSEFPHVVLNQARVHDFYLELMRNSPQPLEPHYARRFVDLTWTKPPATTRSRCAWSARRGACGQVETVKARYVVGCDGARSGVRKSIGRQLVGDSANQAWGVMDVLAVTDFPDIRYKVGGAVGQRQPAGDPARGRLPGAPVRGDGQARRRGARLQPRHHARAN